MTTSTQALENSLKRSKTLNIILGALVFFLAVVVAAQMLAKPGDTTASAVKDGETSADAAAVEGEEGGEGAVDLPEELGEEGPFVRRDPDDPMAIGDVDAPVVMTEWLDFRCPYCALFAQQTLPELIEKYVDTGQLRIEFVDVSYFGDQSTDAAVAARAAAEQGLFFEYMEEVYARDDGNGHQDLPRETLIEIAQAIDMPDMAKFEKDLDSPELREQVEESTQMAQGMGVSSVPFFVVRDVSVAGAQPAEVFHEFIQQNIDAAE